MAYFTYFILLDVNFHNLTYSHISASYTCKNFTLSSSCSYNQAHPESKTSTYVRLTLLNGISSAY